MCLFLRLLFGVMQLALLGRVLYSWVDQNPFSTNPVKELLWGITEPVLAPLRRVMPPTGMFDFSPMIALLVLVVLQQVVMGAAACP
jgi:YggT family protein